MIWPSDHPRNPNKAWGPISRWEKICPLLLLEVWQNQWQNQLAGRKRLAFVMGLRMASSLLDVCI
jgi:hypothetical protein